MSWHCTAVEGDQVMWTDNLMNCKINSENFCSSVKIVWGSSFVSLSGAMSVVCDLCRFHPALHPPAMILILLLEKKKGLKGAKHRTVLLLYTCCLSFLSVGQSVKVQAKLPRRKLWITPTSPAELAEGRVCAQHSSALNRLSSLQCNIADLTSLVFYGPAAVLSACQLVWVYRC